MLVSASEDWVATPWGRHSLEFKNFCSRVSWDGEKPRSHPALTVCRAGEALRLLRERTRKKRGLAWVCWVLWNMCVARAYSLDCEGLEDLGRTTPRSHSAVLSGLEEAPDPHCPSFRRKQPLGPHPRNDTKERKGAPYFNYLPCVPSFGTAFSSWVFAFVTDIAGL